MEKTSGKKSNRRQGATAIKEKRTGGREVWRVSADGHYRTTATSSVSVSVMDKAMIKYKRALKRLADR